MVWFDTVGNATIEKVGKQEVEVFSTGHDKQNIMEESVERKRYLTLPFEEKAIPQRTNN